MYEGDDEAKQKLQRIMNVDFLAQLSGLSDIYSVLGKTCNAFQKVNVFLWQRRQFVQDLVAKFRLMIDAIDADHLQTEWPTAHEYWPMLRNRGVARYVAFVA